MRLPQARQVICIGSRSTSWEALGRACLRAMLLFPSMRLLGCFPSHKLGQGPQAQAHYQLEPEAVGMHILMDPIKLALPHMADQTNIDGAFDGQSLKDRTMMIFHTELLTVGPPVENLDLVFIVVAACPSGQFRQRRDLRISREGMAGWHHDPHAVLRDELREVIHVVCIRRDVQVGLNERLIGWIKRVLLHRRWSFRAYLGYDAELESRRRSTPESGRW